jgi:hypothetical protein
MTARTIIAKLLAFLFVQDSVRSNTNLHNLQILLLGTGKKFICFFGIIFKKKGTLERTSDLQKRHKYTLYRLSHD